jgi:hypothetical protein
LAISKEALGPDHTDVAVSLNNLAGLYKTQERYADAEPLYKRSLVIWEKAHGPNSDLECGKAQRDCSAIAQHQDDRDQEPFP